MIRIYCGQFDACLTDWAKLNKFSRDDTNKLFSVIDIDYDRISESVSFFKLNVLKKYYTWGDWK